MSPEQGASNTRELLTSAESLGDLIRDNAAYADEHRRIADEVVDAVTAAGLMKMMVPRRYGGFEASIATYLAVAAKIAEFDGATAWIVALGNINAWGAATFGKEAQDEIFGKDPDVRICGVLAPSAQSRAVAGGYRVTGRWGFASGSSHAQWGMLGMPISDERGEAVDTGMCLIPFSDVTIEDTWHTTGMRGTASNTLVVDDVFVPAHRVQSTSAIMRGIVATPYADETLYRSVAFVPLAAIVLAAPQVGMARAVFDLVRLKSTTRGVAYTKHTRQADSAAFQIALAQAAMLIQTAELHVGRVAGQIDAALESGVMIPMVDRARIRAHAGYAIEAAREAIDRLMSAHGAGAFAEVSPLQRFWRDSNTAARHAVINSIHNYEIYGKALAGFAVEDNITDLI